jgi:UDP-glucose 4-epimerase
VLKRPGPIRRPFIVADPEPLTVPEMIAAMRAGLSRAPGLLPVPASLLHLAAKFAHREEQVERLAGSLAASPDALRRAGWQPAVATRDALASLCRSFAAGA